MCGLFGWILTKPEPVLAAVLALESEDRGTDSWGAATPDRTRWEATKGLGRVGSVLAWLAREPVVMGHTRHATQGEVTIPNAHPFRREKILLAHNGAVYGRAAETYPVDSMILAYRIAVGRALKDLDGWGCVTWTHDDWTSGVRLCRIGSGPLHYASGRWGTAWASERGALTLALRAARLEASVKECAEHTVYAASIGGVVETTKRLRWRAGSKVYRWTQEDLEHWYAAQKKPLNGDTPSAPVWTPSLKDIADAAE